MLGGPEATHVKTNQNATRGPDLVLELAISDLRPAAMRRAHVRASTPPVMARRGRCVDV